MTAQAAPTFSGREIDVMRLLARGLTFPEIGLNLGISTRTAQQYGESARKKLGVRFSRALPEAYRRATGIDLAE